VGHADTAHARKTFKLYFYVVVITFGTTTS